MKTINITAQKEQRFLKEIFQANKMHPFIPTNSILFKNITGIGATTLELEAKRHSIIVEPNSPVIIGKQKKYPKAFAVKYNVGRTDIIKYLKNDSIEFKKIIVTPESFNKVMKAFKILKRDVYKEFFLLFDECEKVSKDVKFRPSIILPMEDFFQFENKAFVSATPIIPTDPRFENQGFKIYNIVPDYDISHNIIRYNTNNSIDTLMELLEKDNTGNRHFIFLNNVNAITTIIQRMNSHKSSSIFCSETTAMKLRREKYNHVGTSIDESKFSKYTFFTSRYFSAVDIDLEENVNIYTISDVNISLNTLLDPHTDVVQIIGRFRNSAFEKTTHVISTANENVPYMNKEEVKIYLLILRGVYDTIEKILGTVTDIDTNKILDELQKILDFRRFIMPDGTVNYYMIDNIYYENNITSFYISPYKLDEQYRNSVLLNTKIKRYNVVNTITKSHKNGSDHIYLFGEIRSYADIMDQVISELSNAELGVETGTPNKEIVHLKNKYKSMFPELIEAYDLVGAEKLLEECDSKVKVNMLIQKVKGIQEGGNLAFISELKKTLFVGKFASGDDLIKTFSDLLNKHKIEVITPTMPNLGKYISLSKRTRKNSLRGYYIEKHLI
ncbi:hypothetical protein [Sphingobacterium spiritivorum]|uniref:hypothetical protein n=1 Tax=Sphingobacterium spiritivorum TaxID=258 RepID=UPI003DA55302